MGGVHLNAYANIPEVEVVGVADAKAVGMQCTYGRGGACHDQTLPCKPRFRAARKLCRPLRRALRHLRPTPLFQALPGGFAASDTTSRKG